MQVVTGARATPVEARSADGRTFVCSTLGGGAVFRVGDIVVLGLEDGEHLLGQIQSSSWVPIRGEEPHWEATGSVVGALGDDLSTSRDHSESFASASVELASMDHVRALQRVSGADMPVGTYTSGAWGLESRLRTGGFNRHTFLCGQSGSGKTYALGVVLEQLMLASELRTVILDPNADFVRLGEARPETPPAVRRALIRNGVRVLGADSTGFEPLRLRFATMPRLAQAAMLRLDPLRDRREYRLFASVMDEIVGTDIEDVVGRMASGDVDERALADRILNLGLLEWEVFANDLKSAAEVVGDHRGITVMDLSGFDDPHEPLAVSLDLVERLWARRHDRVPTLLVIDEAHNLCPPSPDGPLQTALVERLVQIAAEGRKYGLWLFLSTQRPSKVHAQVLSQCDNLMVMRMNSTADIEELTQLFGFVPPSMIAASQTFRQGEALMAGGFSPLPAMVTMRDRLTFEGGADVRVPVRKV